jgi:hypothetical protein
MKLIACKIKEKFFHPIPVFGQLVALVRQANVERVIQRTKADKYSKKFKTKGECFFKPLKSTIKSIENQ